MVGVSDPPRGTILVVDDEPTIVEVLSRYIERAGFQVALPQDEFLGTDQVADVIRSFGVDHVFSVAPESEWPLIYEGIDRGRVGISRVLTGYLDEDTMRRVDAIVAGGGERDIDIGYRTGPPKPFLGRQAMLKTEIADVVRERALARGLRVDITTRPDDTLLGDDWYRWLARCRWTIGVDYWLASATVVKLAYRFDHSSDPAAEADAVNPTTR